MTRSWQAFGTALLWLAACDPVSTAGPVDACGDACEADQVCVAGTCQAKVCEPFAQRCLDARILATCNGNGTRLREEPCPSGSTCTGTRCSNLGCESGELFCGTDGVRRRCAADGTSSTPEPCEDGLGCTGAGECVPQICPPGEVTCHAEGGRDYTACNASGTATAVGRCEVNQLCVQGACRRRICEPGAPGCEDALTSGTCNAHGTGYEDPVDCALTTGAACNQATGRCASACDIAASMRSYIGCDYWFAITDNAANDLSNARFSEYAEPTFWCEPPADEFPAAVVVANTNEGPVRLTLRDGRGAVVTLPAARAVAPIPTVVCAFGYCSCTEETALTPVEVSSKILVGSAVATILDGQLVAELELPPGATAQLLLPSSALNYSVIADEGYNLVSTLPVSAYLFNPICCNFAYTNDASLLLPRGAWRKGYFAVSAPHTAGLHSGDLHLEGRPAGLAVVAAEDDTRVAIRLRAGQSATQFHVPEGLAPFRQVEGRQELRATLNKGQVLQLETALDTPRADVTGVLVAGDKPIGLFSLHECMGVPEGYNACDHLEEMMLPIDTWGRTYHAVMPKKRNPSPIFVQSDERLFYLVLSSADANPILLSPPPADIGGALDDSTPACQVSAAGELTLDDGGYCEFSSAQTFVISARDPVLVVAVFSGQQSTGLGAGEHGGDPAMAQLVPVDQYRRTYSFLTPDSYWADYTTITFLPSSIIELDGVRIDPGLADQALGESRLVEIAAPVPGTDYQRMTVQLSRGAHTLRSLDAAEPTQLGDRFGIFNYGYDDWVSYAYPGGLDLVQTQEYGNLPVF